MQIRCPQHPLYCLTLTWGGGPVENPSKLLKTNILNHHFPWISSISHKFSVPSKRNHWNLKFYMVLIIFQKRNYRNWNNPHWTLSEPQLSRALPDWGTHPLEHSGFTRRSRKRRRKSMQCMQHMKPVQKKFGVGEKSGWNTPIVLLSPSPLGANSWHIKDLCEGIYKENKTHTNINNNK